MYGPYEEKIVMHQGNTDINGPHQGAWIDTKNRRRLVYYSIFRIKKPMAESSTCNRWFGKTIGQLLATMQITMVLENQCLRIKNRMLAKLTQLPLPPKAMIFNTHTLGLQWQWHANPDISYGFPSGNLGFFRLNCIVRPENSEGLWNIPNLLLQKFPAEEFTAITKFTFTARTDNEEAGFVVMGDDYQYISLKRIDNKMFVRAVQCKNARLGGKETELFSEEFNGTEVYFKIEVEKGAICSFAYSTNGKKYKEITEKLEAKPGRWIGAKIGYFALREGITNDSGTVDIDWIKIDK